MFGWLRSRGNAQSEQLQTALRALTRSRLLVNVWTHETSEYTKKVASGVLSAPAVRRAGASVVDIWRDSRWDVFSHLLAPGCDAGLLGDAARQRALFECWITLRPQAELSRPPTGQALQDTLRAVGCAYRYLGELGAAVGDTETDPSALRKQGKTLLSNLDGQAAELHLRWKPGLFRSLGLPAEDEGSTLIEILVDDLTAKAKGLALCARFGPAPLPAYRRQMERSVEHLRRAGATAVEVQAAAQAMRASMNRVLAARTPEEAALEPNDELLFGG